MASLLSVENLQVQFQTKKGINTAVDGVSFSVENGFSFWCVADNLRAGVAKNAFEIMKKMLNPEFQH